MDGFGWGFAIGVVFTSYVVGVVASFLAENSLPVAFCWPWNFLKEIALDIRDRFGK